MMINKNIGHPYALSIGVLVAASLHSAFAFSLWRFNQDVEITAAEPLNFEMVELAQVIPEPLPLPIVIPTAPVEKPVEKKLVESVATSEFKLPEKNNEKEIQQEQEPQPEIVSIDESTQEILAEPEPPITVQTPTPELIKEVDVKPEAAPLVQRSSSAIVAPRSDAAYFNNPKPPYPVSARRRGLEGTVLLAVDVNAQGFPSTVLIKESSGHEILDKTAKKTVERWQFHPARQNGQAIAAWVDVPIRFALN